MPNTLVEVHGILDDACRDDEQPNEVVQWFVVPHSNAVEFGEKFNVAMAEILRMQAMTIVKDPRKPITIGNLYMVPIHRIARLEFVTRSMVGEYPDGTEGVKQ